MILNHGYIKIPEHKSLLCVLRRNTNNCSTRSIEYPIQDRHRKVKVQSYNFLFTLLSLKTHWSPELVLKRIERVMSDFHKVSKIFLSDFLNDAFLRSIWTQIARYVRKSLSVHFFPSPWRLSPDLFGKKYSANTILRRMFFSARPETSWRLAAFAGCLM